MTPPSRLLAVAVLGREGCPDLGVLRRALEAARVGYAFVPTGEGDCGFTTPTVRITGGYGGPQTLVRPDPDRVASWLERLGVAVAQARPRGRATPRGRLSPGATA